jgi:hypothetical protein
MERAFLKFTRKLRAVKLSTVTMTAQQIGVHCYTGCVERKRLLLEASSFELSKRCLSERTTVKARPGESSTRRKRVHVSELQTLTVA